MSIPKVSSTIHPAAATSNTDRKADIVVCRVPELLFIYGTLHPDRAPAAIAPTARLLKPFGGPGANRATLQARLYNLGAYPGVLLSDDPSEAVVGELFELPIGSQGTAILALLDAYEDFRITDPTNSLFLRQRTVATLADGATQECWVYTYNQPLP